MIKIICRQKPYRYDYAGYQAFDAKAEIEMEEDCSFSDMLEAILKISEYMGYSKLTKNQLKEIIDDLDYNFREEGE